MTSSLTTPPPGPVTDLMWAQWKTKLLAAAVDLGVFTALAGGPLSAGELGTAVGLHPRLTTDFLDALVALDLLRRDEGAYANSDAAGEYLDARQGETYLGSSIAAQCAGLATELTSVLRTGRPSLPVSDGTEFYAHTYSSPGGVRAFQRDMTLLSIGSVVAMSEKFPWSRHRSVADIGTAEGTLPAHLARRHPHLRAIGFDLPVAEGGFRENVQRLGVGDRVEFRGGDFFSDPLPRADVLVLGHILHNWDTGQKVALLRAAYDAVPDGGAVIVYETLIDDDRSRNAVGLILSLIMHMEVPGGYDYTGAQCQEWMRHAGFRTTSVTHLDGPESMVVGVR